MITINPNDERHWILGTSWTGYLKEAYIRALAMVYPTSLEEADETMGFYVFQLAALWRGDLDSSHHLLRMCLYLLES